MSVFVLGSPAQCASWRATLAQLEGMPRRSTVHGGPDLLPQTYTPGAPGFTDQVVEEATEQGVNAALEVPDGYEKHLGKGQPKLPEAFEAVPETDIRPNPLKDKVRGRKGKNPDGSPKEPGLPVAQGKSK